MADMGKDKDFQGGVEFEQGREQYCECVEEEGKGYQLQYQKEGMVYEQEDEEGEGMVYELKGEEGEGKAFGLKDEEGEGMVYGLKDLEEEGKDGQEVWYLVDILSMILFKKI